MGERKVLNKYYPPDFDPSALPRARRPKDRVELVRFMLPMTVRCETCGEYMYAGKKFNAHKELAKGEEYLGIKVFRLMMKCVVCASQFSIKTDPKNADYVCESGVSRNFEPWRAAKQSEEEAARLQDTTDLDAMQALESRTLAAREEMDALDQLEEIKAANARGARVRVDEVIDKVRGGGEEARRREEVEREERERAAREAFEAKRKRVVRVDEGEESGSEGEAAKKVKAEVVEQPQRDFIIPAKPVQEKKIRPVTILRVQPKARESTAAPSTQKLDAIKTQASKSAQKTKTAGALSSLAGYGDASSSSSSSSS